MRLGLKSSFRIHKQTRNWLDQAGVVRYERKDMEEITKPKTRTPNPSGKASAATDDRRVESSIDRSSRQLIEQWFNGQPFKLVQIGDRWIVIPAA
jgi:hypothetical protein